MCPSAILRFVCPRSFLFFLLTCIGRLVWLPQAVTASLPHLPFLGASCVSTTAQIVLVCAHVRSIGGGSGNWRETCEQKSQERVLCAKPLAWQCMSCLPLRIVCSRSLIVDRSLFVLKSFLMAKFSQCCMSMATRSSVWEFARFHGFSVGIDYATPFGVAGFSHFSKIGDFEFEKRFPSGTVKVTDLADASQEVGVGTFVFVDVHCHFSFLSLHALFLLVIQKSMKKWFRQSISSNRFVSV